MFIDIHVHPHFYEPICQDEEIFSFRQEALNIHKNGIATIKHIENQMRLAGLDRLCLLAQDEASIYGRPVVTNEEVAQLKADFPNMFFGFASVDPAHPSAKDNLIRCFEDLNLNGLSLNCSKLKIYSDNERLLPLYEVCLQYNKPVLFHCGCSYETDTDSIYSQPLQFEPIARKYPDLRIGLEHFGWPWVKETAMLMLKYPNVYVDTGALYFDSALEFYQYIFTQEYQVTWVERSLRHQVMFGSDNPRFEQIRMAHALEQMGFSKGTLDLIKGENALVFLGETK